MEKEYGTNELFTCISCNKCKNQHEMSYCISFGKIQCCYSAVNGYECKQCNPLVSVFNDGTMCVKDIKRILEKEKTGYVLIKADEYKALIESSSQILKKN